MLSAISRIGLISFFVISTVCAIIFTLRMVGYQNPVVEPPHPWYKDQAWVIVPFDCEKAPEDGTIALLKIQPVTKQDWQVECKTGLQDLAGVIQKHSLKKIMFKLQTPEPPAAESLHHYIEKINLDLEIGVWAAVAAVGRELRKKRPDWIFAFDSALALQFQTLNQLYLETWASLWADFWIEDTAQSSSFHLEGRARAEIIRRNKKIIAVDDGLQELPKDAKGILTTRPTHWLTRLR